MGKGKEGAWLKFLRRNLPLASLQNVLCLDVDDQQALDLRGFTLSRYCSSSGR